MLYYYAHPIDQVIREGGESDPRLNVVANTVHDVVPAVFDPGMGWRISKDAAPEPGLQHANLEVLHHCDGLIAYLPDGIPTIGTVIELLAALEEGKPTLVLVDNEVRSWALCALEDMNGHLTIRPVYPTESLGITINDWVFSR